MENIISSLARFTKKQVDSAKKAISKYAGQVINLVPEPIRRTVNTFTGNLITKIVCSLLAKIVCSLLAVMLPKTVSFDETNIFH